MRFPWSGPQAGGGPAPAARLLHFAVDSKWSDRHVRRVAAQYALEAMTHRESVEVWMADDTGFLKQGQHSVGVQRQSTGSAGKVAHGQRGVSLRVATRTEHLPLDFELYLPECWAHDAARRRETRLPADVPFKTKPQLALQMIDRAVRDGVPPGLVLGDAAYGSSSQFRAHLRTLGLHSAVAVDPQTTVCLLNEKGRPQGNARSVSDLALRIHEREGFRLSRTGVMDRTRVGQADRPGELVREPLFEFAALTRLGAAKRILPGA